MSAILIPEQSLNGPAVRPDAAFLPRRPGLLVFGIMGLRSTPRTARSYMIGAFLAAALVQATALLRLGVRQFRHPGRSDRHVLEMAILRRPGCARSPRQFPQATSLR
jgi:hypothetical protein